MSKPKRTRSTAPSVHAGQGHGNRTYRPVRVTNRLATEDGRAARREVLAAREVKRAEYLAALSVRAEAKVAA